MNAQKGLKSFALVSLGQLLVERHQHQNCSSNELEFNYGKQHLGGHDGERKISLSTVARVKNEAAATQVQGLDSF